MAKLKYEATFADGATIKRGSERIYKAAWRVLWTYTPESLEAAKAQSAHWLSPQQEQRQGMTGFSRDMKLATTQAESLARRMACKGYFAYGLEAAPDSVSWEAVETKIV